MNDKVLTLGGFCLGSLVLLLGCGQGDGEYGQVEKGQEVEDEQGHHHHDEPGPHGGHLIALTPENENRFHAELAFDGESRVTTLYVLTTEDEHEFEEYPIAADEIVFHLEAGDHEHDADEDHGDESDADAEDSEAHEDEAEHAGELLFVAVREEGGTKTAKFELAAENLPESIEDEEDFHGHLHVAIDGKEYEGEIAHDHAH